MVYCNEILSLLEQSLPICAALLHYSVDVDVRLDYERKHNSAPNPTETLSDAQEVFFGVCL